MMSFWNGVTPQSVANAPDGFKEFQVGENEAFIQQVNETTSKNSGKDMLDIIFKKMDGAEIHYYIVDDEYKMEKLKKLCLCFGIPMGSTNIEEWRGKRGIVVCKPGEPYGDSNKIYNKVSYLKPLVPANGAKPSTNNGYSASNNGYSASNNGYSASNNGYSASNNGYSASNADSFDDDIPF
jgi:hypothetical protein